MARPAYQSDTLPTRTRLLDAAESEFATVGFSGGNLAEIAALAGIRRPSLLYHFSSKEKLYIAVVERTLDDIADALVGTMQTGGAVRDIIIALVERFARFLEARPSAARILLREVLDDRGPGREIVVKQGSLLLNLVESFLHGESKNDIPTDFPLRAMLMQAVSNLLLWTAVGPLRQPLWGGYHNAPEIVSALWHMDSSIEQGVSDAI